MQNLLWKKNPTCTAKNSSVTWGMSVRFGHPWTGWWQSQHKAVPLPVPEARTRVGPTPRLWGRNFNGEDTCWWGLLYLRMSSWYSLPEISHFFFELFIKQFQIILEDRTPLILNVADYLRDLSWKWCSKNAWWTGNDICDAPFCGIISICQDMRDEICSTSNITLLWRK